MIEIKNVSKTYDGKKKVLKNVLVINYMIWLRMIKERKYL